jgi:hypothetical protein
MWHCAAATALWQCQNEEQKTNASYLITIIRMKENVEKRKGGILAVSLDESLKQGSNTYNYFHSIQIPAFLARINKLETKFGPVFGPNIAKSPGYSETIGHLYCWHYGEQDAVCSVMWDRTKESDKDANKGTFALLGVKEPVSLAKEVLFCKEFIPELPKSAIPPPPFEGGLMLHLWASTTITMQYLHEQGNRSERIKHLQEQLGRISESSSSWVNRARSLIRKLVGFATKEGIDGKNDKRVLLFNYRIGDVNKQHDANIHLLKSITKITKTRGFVVVPLIVGASPEEVSEIKKVTHSILELYEDDIPYDKRYTAAFWAIVANELQDTIVHGVIGGRSGSMDIASFMGVNTCSFDEPVFGNKCYDDDDIRKQGGQLLRLLAQHAIMSVVYVDATTLYKKTRTNGHKYNAYKKLDKDGVEQWLDRRPSDLHIWPKLIAEEIRVRCTRSVVTAMLIYHF